MRMAANEPANNWLRSWKARACCVRRGQDPLITELAVDSARSARYRFLALVGSAADGHDYVPAAEAAGAVAIIASRPVDTTLLSWSSRPATSGGSRGGGVVR